MVTTAQSLGDDLPSLEANLVHLMEERFADEDGYYRGEIHARSMRPYESTDAEILPPEKQWARRGLMPEEAMAVHMNYEDASMTTGNYVQALIAKFEKTGDPETRRILRKAFEAMSLLHRTTAETNEYGEGFIPKPYLGIRDVSAIFEMSADQWLKFGRALDRYRAIATPPERARAEEILLSMATWLDDHDFVTPYLGGPVYGRLMPHEHYPAVFAWFMATAAGISGNRHFEEEALALLNKALEKEGNIPSWEGAAEPCINVQNLMTESLVPLMDRFPERRPAMVKRLNWWWRQANECQLQPDWSSMHHAVHLNTAPLSACTYVQICEVLEPGQQPMDIDAVLLEQNRMEHFMVMRNAKNCAITGWMESRTSLSAQMIAAWLRAYWESR